MQALKLGNCHGSEAVCVGAGRPKAFQTMGVEGTEYGENGVFLRVNVNLYGEQSIGSEPPPMPPPDMVAKFRATVALLAAAPELLAALRLIVTDGVHVDMPNCHRETALAAIAKAEGRAS